MTVPAVTASADGGLPGALPASPCIDVCRMDGATGWCAGCLRTLDEIAGWSRMDGAARRAVCDALPPRRLEWQRRHPDLATAKP